MLHVVDVATRREIKKVNLRESREKLVGVAVAPDGSLLAAGTGIWNVSLAEAGEEPWLRWPRDGSWDDRPERVAEALDGLLAMVSQEGTGYPQGTAELRSAKLGGAIASQRPALSRSSRTPIARWRNRRTRSKKFRRAAGNLPRRSGMPTS